MILGTPGGLWWLLLVPLVILLYMLRARREPRVVPSTLLWERAARDLVARMPVRRLERTLLLLLQILAIAAVALALARPSLVLPSLAGDAVVLVVQTTASMQATDEPPTRFTAAQRKALALLGSLGPRQPVALIAAGYRPQLLRDFTVDHGAVAEAVRALQPSDAAGSVEEAVALAANLRVGGRPVQVHLFGDRAPSGAQLTWHRVGRGAPNAAITAAAVRTDASGRALLSVRIEAFGERADRVLAVSVEGRTLARRRVRPGPGAPELAVVPLGEISGVVTARLEGTDALPADDRAAVAVGREALPRVLVVGETDPALEAVLRAIPLASVQRSDRIAPGQWGQADVVLLDSLPPLNLPPGAYLLIGTLPENLPLQIEGDLHDQVVRALSATHPVMRLADMRGVRIAAAAMLRLPGGTVLAEGDGPLIWAFEGRTIRAVILPFALSQTDLPFHPAFPVLMANAISWLAGGSQVAAGGAPIVPAGVRRTATLIDPTGQTRTVTARDGLFSLPALDRVGLYQLRADGWERRWIVATVDARESDLSVAPVPPIARANPLQAAHVSIVHWLLGLAALLVAGEWLLWARTVPPRRDQVRGR
jgi:hypothetical protein